MHTPRETKAKAGAVPPRGGPGGCRITPPAPPVASTAEVRQVCLRVALAVAEDFGLDVCALYSCGRGPARLSVARQTAMYLSHISLGLAVSGVGECFGRHFTTVYYACAAVEERREDTHVDRELARLEALVAGRLTGEPRP